MDYRHTLHALLYVSIFDPKLEINSVVTLLNRARTKNKVLNITGILLFDGERFCQYLEGGMKDVVDLFKLITLDAMHTNVELLHQGTIDHRHFLQFNLGFSYLADIDVIGSIGSKFGSAARDLLFELKDSIDIGN